MGREVQRSAVELEIGRLYILPVRMPPTDIVPAVPTCDSASPGATWLFSTPARIANAPIAECMPAPDLVAPQRHSYASKSRGARRAVASAIAEPIYRKRETPLATVA
jgi:hypothetical protein